MANEWILEVLADLTTFAEENDLPALECQLVMARQVAEIDISANQGMSPHSTGQGIGHVGLLHRTTAESCDTR